MDNDRNNRDSFRDRGYGGYDADRNTWQNRQDYGSNRDYGARDDYSRRDYGGSGNFYGSNRDDYGSRQGSGFNSDRGYGAGQSGGGYDEWSRRGTQGFSDRYSGDERSRSYYGDYDRNYGNYSGRFGSDNDRFYRGQSGVGEWSGGRAYGGGERGSAEGGRGFWDKASDEVSSWFGDRDAERRRETDQHRGRGPKGYTRSDDRIRDDINDRLTDDGWLDASDIEVNVSNREVTLTGSVSDRNAKRRAEDIAEGVSGVSHVQNNVRVKSKDATSTDVDIDRSENATVAKAGMGGMR